MLDVCILGNSGMQPLPDRHLASALLRYDGTGFLIDCGEGTQVAIKKKGWSIKNIGVICLTHYHTDHISGLPGLLASMANSDKTDVLTIIGPSGLEKMVNASLTLAPKLPYRINLITVPETYQKFSIHGLQIESFACDHTLTCHGYTFTVKRNGKFDLEKAQCNGVPEELWGRLQQGEIIEYNGKFLTKDLISGDPRKGIKVTYCTDTRPVQSIVKYAAGSDLFVCEGMYGDEANYENALKNKHMMFNEAASLAAKASVKELWLTHYSPGLAHPEMFLSAATDVFKNTVLTKCGMSVNLEFEK